jgi:prophage DNA circulation protein
MADLIPAGIGPLVQNLGLSRLIDQSDASWLGSTWWAQLQPGSWRGVGFVMDAAELRTGRRVATHEYPYRDTVWAEDLGKLPRRFAFQAFLVGDDVYQQRDAMVAACEQPGAGTLVHPTMGSVQCVLVDFTTTDRRERGRVVELAFQFVVAADATQPTAASSTGDAVAAAATGATQAAQSDLQLNLGALDVVPSTVLPSINQFAGLAIGTVNDAARALNAVTGLAGYFGRYAAGNRATLLPIGSTVASALATAVTTRTAVITAATALQAATEAL